MSDVTVSQGSLSQMCQSVSKVLVICETESRRFQEDISWVRAESVGSGRLWHVDWTLDTGQAGSNTWKQGSQCLPNIWGWFLK